MDELLLFESAPATHFRVRGSDAFPFLQGQFTNELRGPAPERSVYGLWLNQKGKVLADSHVLIRAGGSIEIVSTGSTAEVIRGRLEPYIVADDVEIEDTTAGALLAGVAGAGAAALLGALGIEAPGVGGLAGWEGAAVFRGRFAGRRPAWIFAATSDAGSAWRGRLREAVTAAGGREAKASELDLLRVLDGVVAVPGELGPADLPMEGGLEHEAISFTKGCYLGQEVMARLHNMGRVRRRLHLVRVSGDAAAPVGETILIDGKPAGELRGALPRGDERVGLAMLQTHLAEGGGAASLASGGRVELLGLAEGRAW